MQIGVAVAADQTPLLSFGNLSRQTFASTLHLLLYTVYCILYIVNLSRQTPSICLNTALLLCSRKIHLTEKNTAFACCRTQSTDGEQICAVEKSIQTEHSTCRNPLRQNTPLGLPEKPPPSNIYTVRSLKPGFWTSIEFAELPNCQSEKLILVPFLFMSLPNLTLGCFSKTLFSKIKLGQYPHVPLWGLYKAYPKAFFCRTSLKGQTTW